MRIFNCKFIERSDKSDLIVVEPEGSHPDDPKGFIALTEVPKDSPFFFFRSTTKFHETFLATYVVPHKSFQMEGPDKCTEVKFGDKPVLLVDGGEFTFPHAQLTDKQFKLYNEALKSSGLKALPARKTSPKK